MGHETFTTDEHGQKWCEDCQAEVHRLVEHEKKHSYGDFAVGLVGDSDIQHAVLREPIAREDQDVEERRARADHHTRVKLGQQVAEIRARHAAGVYEN